MDCWCVCDRTLTSRIRLNGFEGEGGKPTLHTTRLDTIFTSQYPACAGLGCVRMGCDGVLWDWGVCGGDTGLGSLGRVYEKGPA